MIQSLRNEIRALENEIANKQARINELLHDEARINELIEMIRNANLNVEQLEAIVNAINNMEDVNSIPTINIPITENIETVEITNNVETTDTVEMVEDVEITDTVEMVEDVEVVDTVEMVEDVEVVDTVEMVETPRFTTVDTRIGEIQIEIPENRPSSWCTSLDECTDGINLTVEEMATADMTIVGVRHQDLLMRNHYVPQIGELVRLEKETQTSNCYAILIASEVNDLEEDMAIGILPTDNGSKQEELYDNGFPCVCHQDMWENPDLNELYEVTGVVVGRYVTIRKSETNTSITEEEETIEEQSSIDSTLLDLRTLVGTASTIAEARNVFSNEMSNQCTIRRDLDAPIQEISNGFIVYYDDHRHNEMENVHQAILVSKPE